MDTSNTSARKTWTKPTVTDVDLVANTRTSNGNTRPSGEAFFYGPLS